MRLGRGLRHAGAALAVLLLALLAWAWTPDLPRAELEARYLEAPADLRDIGGQRLHLRDRGPRDAPVLLLVHGFGASLHTWDAWARELEREYRVLRFDLPGSGLSAPDAAGDYRDARTHALMLRLLDTLGIARAGIVGHSIGGRIAWGFAARHPERVERLVLLAADGFESPGRGYGQAAEVPLALDLMQFLMPLPLLRANLAPAYAQAATLDDALLARSHALLRAPGSRAALRARMAQTVLVDPLPLLRSIAAPTLVLWGAQDRFIPATDAARFAAALPRAQLQLLPGVGHVPQEEGGAPALARLRAFLSGSAPP